MCKLTILVFEKTEYNDDIFNIRKENVYWNLWIFFYWENAIFYWLSCQNKSSFFAFDNREKLRNMIFLYYQMLKNTQKHSFSLYFCVTTLCEEMWLSAVLVSGGIS